MPLVNRIAVSVKAILRLFWIGKIERNKLNRLGRRFVPLVLAVGRVLLEFVLAILGNAGDKGQITGKELLGFDGLIGDGLENEALGDDAVKLGVGIILVSDHRDLFAG